MKPNEAPEKIFIQSFSNEEDTIYFDAVWTEEPEPRQENIEYTRTDAFIDKASIWLKENVYLYVNDYTGSLNEDVLIDEFKKYMKGE